MFRSISNPFRRKPYSVIRVPVHTHTHIPHTQPHTHTHTYSPTHTRTPTQTHTHTHHIYPLGKIRPPLNLLATLSSNHPCTKITVKPVEIKPSETESVREWLQGAPNTMWHEKVMGLTPKTAHRGPLTTGDRSTVTDPRAQRRNGEDAETAILTRRHLWISRGAFRSSPLNHTSFF